MSEKEKMEITTEDVGVLKIGPGGAFEDAVSVADKVFADVIPGGGDPPHFPCPQCGRETKVHHDHVEYDAVKPKKVLAREPQRICSMPKCRTVVRGEDDIELIAKRGKAMQPVIIPCEQCGKATKEHQPDPETEEPRRICAVPTCRNVQLA